MPTTAPHIQAEELEGGSSQAPVEWGQGRSEASGHERAAAAAAHRRRRGAAFATGRRALCTLRTWMRA